MTNSLLDCAPTSMLRRRPKRLLSGRRFALVDAATASGPRGARRRKLGNLNVGRHERRTGHDSELPSAVMSRLACACRLIEKRVARASRLVRASVRRATQRHRARSSSCAPEESRDTAYHQPRARREWTRRRDSAAERDHEEIEAPWSPFAGAVICFHPQRPAHARRVLNRRRAR